jgi:hypothetical protein
MRTGFVCFVSLALILPACDSLPAERRAIEAGRCVSEVNAAEFAFHSRTGRFGQLQVIGSAAFDPVRWDESIRRTGYVFNLRVSDSSYELVALGPLDADGTRRSFFSDQTGVVRTANGMRPASTGSPRIDGDGSEP